MAGDSRKGKGGPKTIEGIRRAAMNAYKHGLYVRSQEGLRILEQTVGCTYAETLEHMRAHFKPLDPLEEVLVRRIARSTWRMMVTESAENNVLGNCGEYVEVDRPYQDIIHTERFVDVHLHRAVAALQQKRDRENACSARNAGNASTVRRSVE